MKEESNHRGWQTVCVVRWQTSEKFEWNTRQWFSSVCCCSFCLIWRSLTVTLSATPNERATTFRIAVSWSATPPRDYAAITRITFDRRWVKATDIIHPQREKKKKMLQITTNHRRRSSLEENHHVLGQSSRCFEKLIWRRWSIVTAKYRNRSGPASPKQPGQQSFCGKWSKSEIERGLNRY